MKRLLTTIVFSLFLCIWISTPVNASSVTSSAVVSETVVEAEPEIDLVEAVELFGVGIACGIVFSTLMFVLSLVINLFFDIVKK